jgi:ABC-2 type transport system ATP-binding protein
MSSGPGDSRDYPPDRPGGTVISMSTVTSSSTAGATDSTGIRVTGLRKSYGRTVAVDGIDLRVTPGEVVALLGPNGAGKSTTIDMLLGLTRPDAGSVSLFGMAPRDACAAGRVGAMLQSGGLVDDLTVAEMITLMRSLYPRPLPATDILERARVTELADRRAGKLSGGQKQRVRFALALVGDPDLLVLDEPTAAMDVEARHAFWASMRQWTAAGRTVLFATHYLEEADAFADRIVLLRHGRVIADGATTEVKALVGGRAIRATLPDADLAALRALPGVAAVDARGDAVTLTCPDSDAALRALLAGWPAARDIEVTGAGLEAAFLTLTGDGTASDNATDNDPTSDEPAGVPA